MFGWFRYRCPLETFEKTWVEWRMGWLVEQFGLESMLKAHLLLPDDDLIVGQPWQATEANAHRVLEHLSRYLPFSSHRIDLRVVADEELERTAGGPACGLYRPAGDRASIDIAASQLSSPVTLLATLAHELAHEILLGGNLLDPDVADHEWVTDLLPLFFGAGIFATNAVIHDESYTVGNWSYWRIRRQGYLPARMFGYAFALFAWLRRETKPKWASWLRLDAAVALRDGLRFLERGGDSLFESRDFRGPNPTRSGLSWQTRLTHTSPTFRLAAIWELEQSEPREELLDEVVRLLRDKDPAIREATARLLGHWGVSSSVATAEWLRNLRDPCAEVRGQTAETVGQLRCTPEQMVPALTLLLDDDEKTVVQQAVRALREFGVAATPAGKRLVATLIGAIRRCDHDLVNETSAALQTLPTLDALLDDELEDWDDEMQAMVKDACEKPTTVNSATT